MVGMTNFAEREHPRGLPLAALRSGATRGSFAEKSQSAPEAELVTRLTATYGNGFPEPQANCLEKISTVVDALAAGANTGWAVGEALAVTGREGSYYADAAGYLGLVSVLRGSDPKTYALTGLGEAALGMSDDDRCQAIRDIVALSPGAGLLEESGEEAVSEFLLAQGLEGETVLRRTQTIQSWAKAIKDRTGFEGSARIEMAQTRERSVVAARHAHEARRAHPVPRDERCPSCGNQVPLSGVCDFC